tara:strand:+ start:900 stop:1427 length:528 start_codon:yes stop_codon:yes gene_type:complete
MAYFNSSDIKKIVELKRPFANNDPNETVMNIHFNIPHKRNKKTDIRNLPVTSNLENEIYEYLLSKVPTIQDVLKKKQRKVAKDQIEFQIAKAIEYEFSVVSMNNKAWCVQYIINKLVDTFSPQNDSGLNRGRTTVLARPITESLFKNTIRGKLFAEQTTPFFPNNNPPKQPHYKS